MKTVEDLGKILADMYSNAPRKRQVTMVHLFGIEYAEAIKRVGIREIIEASGISPKYQAEVNKGVNLADYVIRK